MNYPYGSYGQGFPGQPGYPQQSGYPQPGYPPQAGFPQQLYAMGPGEPSSATGIIAAILAGLGALAGFISGLISLLGFPALSHLRSASGGTYAIVFVGMLLSLVFGVVLLIGAILLFQRKMLGRWLIVGGCAVAILSSLASLGAAVALTADYSNYLGGGGLLTVLGLIFPIATLALALLPSTAAWIRAKPNPVVPQYYPPYPPYLG